jgi:hypothetical protein
MAGIDDLIANVGFLRKAANAMGMQRQVVEPAELPNQDIRNEFGLAYERLQRDPTYYLPRSTVPTDLPATLAAYRADPTGRFGGKEGLETQPIGLFSKSTANPNDADPNMLNVYNTPSKAVQDLYRAARINGAAAKYGKPAMTPEEIAAFALKEGRSDLGYNSLRGGPKDKAYEEDLLSRFDITPKDSNFLAAVAAKRRLAERKGITFAEAWNGTGTNDFGKTGKDYASDWQAHMAAAQHERNRQLMEVIQRGIADGQKHGFPLRIDREKNTSAKQKKVPYKHGGLVDKPLAGGSKLI